MSTYRVRIRDCVGNAFRACSNHLKSTEAVYGFVTVTSVGVLKNKKT